MENKTFTLYTCLTTQELYTKLNTNEQGLNPTQVKERQQQYGLNELQESDTTIITLIANQLRNPFIYILFIIATIYFFTQQITETVIIFLIIVINTTIGFYQEYHSNKVMLTLKKYLHTTATVKRAQTRNTINANELVPGDIIILNAGDSIPADCRFVTTENLSVNEAYLTGESVPITKKHEPIEQANTIYDAHNIGFSGTVVTDGHATAIVFATAHNTILGDIAHLTTHTITKSTLAQGTMRLAKVVLFLTVMSLITIILLNVLLKYQLISLLNILLFSAALAITAIPTALPIVITFCLSKGATALQKHKIIVRRLSVIEDLGGIEILCTDKTGTLTENALTISNIYCDDQEQALLYAALSSEMVMNQQKKLPQGFDLAIEQKLTPELQQTIQHYIINASLPFTYERHRTICLVSNKKENVLITKGSAEYVIKQCTFLTESKRSTLNSWIQENELQANRVLALATKKITSFDSSHDKLETYDKEYETIALIAFTDPLKTTAATAVKKAQALDVRIKILSGDSPHVCYAIAHQLGLENNSNNVVLGDYFEKSTEEQKNYLAHNRTIFARVTPEQKYTIIKYLQQTHSVGYMGDGINDAPALKMAQVGIAVNDASDIARQAAEIILLQKSLLNVVLGIEEGRKIITNTLKYITITIASNVGNFYSLAISSLFINYLPMLPLQLLFLDLITDLPLIAISTDAVGKQELKKPLHYDIKDISFVIFIFGLVSLPFDFMIFALFKNNPATLQTCWFITSALKQLVLIFSLRTKLPFYKAQHPSITLVLLCLLSATVVTVLPFTTIGHAFFHFIVPTKTDIIWICVVVSAYFVTTETVKILYYRKSLRN